MYSSTISLTLATDGGSWSTSRSGRFAPEKVPRYPLYSRLCGPQGRTGAENLVPTGI
jgi:hypothetical protein